MIPDLGDSFYNVPSNIESGGRGNGVQWLQYFVHQVSIAHTKPVNLEIWWLCVWVCLFVLLCVVV